MLVQAIALMLASASASSPAGTYQADMMETATALRLEEDGRYQWYFSQGALDLRSTGRWVRDGDRILLSSDPVREPKFRFLGAVKSPEPGIEVRVSGPGGAGVQGIDLIVEIDGGRRLEGTTDADGAGRFDAPAGSARTVTLALPMFDLLSPPFAVGAAGGNVLRFELQPNDIGRERFDRAPLHVEKDGLELEWRGPKILYHRVGE